MFLLFVVYFTPQFGFFSVFLSACFLVTFPLFYINQVKSFYINVKKDFFIRREPFKHLLYFGLYTASSYFTSLVDLNSNAEPPLENCSFKQSSRWTSAHWGLYSYSLQLRHSELTGRRSDWQTAGGKFTQVLKVMKKFPNSCWAQRRLFDEETQSLFKLHKQTAIRWRCGGNVCSSSVAAQTAWQPEFTRHAHTQLQSVRVSLRERPLL